MLDCIYFIIKSNIIPPFCLNIPKKAEKICQDYGNKLTFTFIDNKCKLYKMIHSHTNYFLFCGCLSNIITQRSDFDIILWKKGSFLE